MLSEFRVVEVERPNTLAQHCQQLKQAGDQLNLLSLLLLGLTVLAAIGGGLFVFSRGLQTHLALAGVASALGLSAVLVGIIFPSVLWLLGLRSARRAFESLGDLIHTGRVPHGLAERLRTLKTWLTVWQGAALLSFLMLLVRLLTEKMAQLSMRPENELLFAALLQALISGLTIYIVQRSKQFLERLSQRIQGMRLPLRASARAATPWWQFVEILCWISLVFTVLGTLGLLGSILFMFFHSPLQARLLSGGNLFLVSVGTLLMGIFSVAIYLLLIRMIGTSRRLALELADHFDGEARAGAPGAPPADPWRV